jgi:hypothetical protein
MKKWLTGFCILIILLIASVYIFIPSDLAVSKVELVQCNVNSANKYLGDGSQWGRWWPGVGGRSISAGRGYEYGGVEYRMPGMFRHLMEVQILTPDSSIHSRIGIVGFADNLDSTALQWEFHLDAGWSPIGRIRQYRKAKELRSDITHILSALRTFLENKEKVYGIRIQEVSTTDSFLVAMRATYPVRPSTADITAHIQNLRAIIAREGARETGNPMVNITVVKKDQYDLMAAIPTNRELKPAKAIFSRKLVHGK